MTSLRPLATIILLAAVGVFLYMKINETEPVMPADLGEWSADAPEIGAGEDLAPAAPTSLPTTSITSQAPAYVPTTPVAAATADPSSSAPAWTPGASATPPGAAATAAANDQASSVARTAEPQAGLPALPPLPGAGAPATGTPAADAASPQAIASPFSTPTAAVPNTASASTPAAGNPAEAPAFDPTKDALAAEPVTPTPSTPSMFGSARVAVQGALDRGELAQALLMLSDWYGDPSLTAEESEEVNSLIAQLAGSVIYEGPPAHRLEAPYVVKAGETLDDVSKKYDVPWQLLAKINGVADPNALKPGQELKVVRGPFSAIVDVSERKMTLMLGRYYAGRFPIELDPTSTIEDGQWKVDQKLLTPSAGSLYGQSSAAADDRAILLANPTSASGQAAIIRGPGNADPISGEPAGRIVRLKAGDVADLYDILSVGSRVTIRR